MKKFTMKLIYFSEDEERGALDVREFLRDNCEDEMIIPDIWEFKKEDLTEKDKTQLDDYYNN